jgi:hypothetical protein
MNIHTEHAWKKLSLCRILFKVSYEDKRNITDGTSHRPPEKL